MLCLPAPPAPVALLCAVNPVYRQHLLGKMVKTRNGRQGRVGTYDNREASVIVFIDVGLPFLYHEYPTMDELAKYNGWEKAA